MATRLITCLSNRWLWSEYEAQKRPPAAFTSSLENLLESRQHAAAAAVRGPVRASRQFGQQYTRLRGRAWILNQVRSYQPGDDIPQPIDWRVYRRG